MSKLTKLLTSPRLFFGDTRKKAAIKLVNSMTRDDIVRFPQTKNAQSNRAQSSITPAKSAEDTRNNDIALAHKLLNFERNFPVNTLKSGESNRDILLWPFFRHLLWVRCQAAYKGKNSANVNTSKMYVSPEWQEHYRQILPAKTLEELKEGHCDFLFFSNLRGTEQILIDDNIYNRITDPIFEVAKTLGTAKKVEVIKSIGEIKQERVHEPELVLPPLLRKIGYTAIAEVPQNFVAHVNQHLPEVQFSNKSYNDSIEWFFHQRDFYKALLKKHDPKIIFFVGFDYHYALVCAAKELGIKSVDLQHGVQAGWSPVYNHWHAIPYQGYEMLPDWFWVWGDYDARKISNNFPCESIKPLIGGFPWLDRQSDIVAETPPKILSILSGQKNIGLLTLQDQVQFPSLFEQIIDNTKGQIQWVIKRHPKHQQIDLSRLKGKALFGKQFDNLSFLTLIKIASIHLSECSTSVIEADYFGVPSIVTGSQGELNYRDFIDQGTVYHIESADEFLERLVDIVSIKHKSRMGVVKNGTVESALKFLLEHSYD